MYFSNKGAGHWGLTVRIFYRLNTDENLGKL